MNRSQETRRRPPSPTRPQIKELLRRAREMGASDARAVPPAKIVVDEGLAALCRPPGCGNYGRSPGCPPHVGGPAVFREWLQDSGAAIVIRIDVPTEILLSSQRLEVMELLHGIAVGVEEAAKEMGYRRSMAFAGGSCKQIFCRRHPGCPVVDDGGNCRHPGRARPSMSGFGVDVTRMMAAAGSDEPGDSTAPVCGLVLIG